MAEKKRPPRLTQNEIRAIIEALNSRLAGEMDVEADPDSQSHETYESALQKMFMRRKD